MPRRPLLRPTLMLCVLLALVHGGTPARAFLFDKKDKQETAATETYEPYHGPRKSLAVARFDATGAFTAHFGGYDTVGGGLAAMLIDELSKTNRFVLVDRADFDAILSEQELALNGLATKKTPAAGQLLGAQLIVRGTVTRFTEAEKGGGLRIGGNFGDVSPGLSLRKQVGSVAINLRVIDTTTGQTLISQTVEQELSERAAGIDVATDELRIGGDAFKNRPLGKAVEQAIRACVRLIIDATDTQGWTGLVSKASGDLAYINAGANAGLEVGDRLTVTRTLETITDPESGELLGAETIDIGSLTVEKVEDRYAVARFAGADTYATLDRGDVVHKAPVPDPAE